MRQQLALKQQQKFAFNLRFNAAVQLLQMPAAELKLKLRDELNSNPLLEEIDHTQDVELNEECLASESFDDYSMGSESGAAEAVDDWQYTDHSFDQYSYNTAAQTIHDHLLTQIRGLGLSAAQHRIAKSVVAAIDERGYLESSNRDIHSLLFQNGDINLADIDAVIRIVQQCHPAGVGARSLKECLLLQNQLVDDPIAETVRVLISDHMDLLAEEDYERIKQELAIDMERVQHAIAVIKSFNPIPGNGFGEPVLAVIPDVIVQRTSRGWKTELNEAVLPKLRIADDYRRTIQQTNNEEGNRYIKKRLGSANLLLDNLKRRHRTILAVAQEIVARQLTFLEFGEHAMQPLKLRNIADALNIHESTVSRACSHKYMATPRGTFEFRYFFSRSIANHTGEAESAKSIMHRVRMLIESEDHCKPLSDQKLTDLLRSDGFDIARRTVAKYRSEMGIPGTRIRKNTETVTTT